MNRTRPVFHVVGSNDFSAAYFMNVNRHCGEPFSLWRHAHELRNWRTRGFATDNLVDPLTMSAFSLHRMSGTTAVRHAQRWSVSDLVWQVSLVLQLRQSSLVARVSNCSAIAEDGAVSAP